MNQRLFSTLPFLLFLTITPLLTLSLSSHLSQSPNISKSPSPTPPQYLEIPILQDDAGFFYINITWKNATSHHFEASSSSFLPPKDQDNNISQYTGKMMLSLYSDISFVSTCPDFIPYQCDLLECQPEDYNTFVVSYLFDGMEVRGYPVDIGLESPAFSICGYSMIYAQSCGVSFPTGISGFLGLGFSPNALFQVNQNFSIFLSDGADGLSSTLYVGAGDNAQRIDQSKNFTFSSPTDENWMLSIKGIQAEAQNQESPYKVNIKTVDYIKALFDLNTDAIGLPFDLFNNITAVLQAYGLSCVNKNSNANCSYTGDLDSLPTFYLLAEETNSRIEITPEVYLAPGDNGTSYVLKFEGVVTDVPGRTQVNPQYENTIILGRPFLRQYYVHFSVGQDYKRPFVTIYYANHSNSVPEAPINIKMIAIAGGSSLVFLTILVVFVCICIRNKKKGNKVKESTKEDEEKNTADSSRWRQNFGSSVIKPMTSNASINQPLLNRSPESGRQSDIESKTDSKIWSHEKRRETHEIQAHTYQRQKYVDLYESVSDYSLNDEIREH